MLQINECKSTLRLLQFWDSINFNSFSVPNLFKTYNSCITLIYTSSRNSNHSGDHCSSIRLGNGYLDWEGKNLPRINEMTVTC